MSYEDIQIDDLGYDIDQDGYDVVVDNSNTNSGGFVRISDGIGFISRQQTNLEK